MKKLSTVLLLSLVVLLCVNCAGTTPAPNADPTSAPSSGNTSPLVTVSVEIARAAARVGLNLALQKVGVSPELSAQILADLRMIADSVIAGEGLSVLLDNARWAVVREGLIDRLTLAITSGTTIDGVPLIDSVSAKVLVTSLVDAFAASARRVLVRS